MSRKRFEDRINFRNYETALLAFSNEFGFFPTGSNRTVTAALVGENSDRKSFLRLPAKGTNKRGEFVDSTGKPYDIHVTSNQVHITP